jgi:hypothetical protein
LEKKMAGLLGAVAALGTIGSAQAAPAPNPTDVLRVSSYADLLEPIANANVLLAAMDQQQPAAARDGKVQLAQAHHHHHHHYRGPRVVVRTGRRHHHHHHHYHHHHHQ